MNRYFGLHTLEGEWHALLPRYILLAERLEGRRVLDIGCGSGIGASMLRELGAEMVDAIDHRPAVLEVARMKHAKEGLDFHVMFWEELDFPDDTFDVVLCLDPSSPVTDPSLIQEVRRVLKDGGEYVCAIERKTLGGLESLLPRYGYTDAAESIDINDANERVPQLGELQKHFDKVTPIVQRPLLAFVFDRDEAGESTRKQGDGPGVWIEDEEPSAGEESGRWLSVDNRLSSKEEDPGSVEIWFCGESTLAAPPLKEIRLPYYGITERLEQVVGDLQVRGMGQNLGEEDSLFEEVLDEAPTEAIDDRYDVRNFGADQWDTEPTTLHNSPIPAASPPAADVSQFRDELSELRNLYGRMHDDFQKMMSQAQGALKERDGYIQHLVEQVQLWQDRYTGASGDSTGRQESLRTGVYKKLDTPSMQGQDRRELEAEVGRLRDEQRRLSAELEQKNAFLRANDDSETGERAAPVVEPADEDVDEGVATGEHEAKSEPKEERSPDEEGDEAIGDEGSESGSDVASEPADEASASGDDSEHDEHPNGDEAEEDSEDSGDDADDADNTTGAGEEE